MQLQTHKIDINEDRMAAFQFDAFSSAPIRYDHPILYTKIPTSNFFLSDMVSQVFGDKLFELPHWSQSIRKRLR